MIGGNGSPLSMPDIGNNAIRWIALLAGDVAHFALMKRVSESEQAAEQATKRFEEMAIKLGEIAGLASQLGNGKRRS